MYERLKDIESAAMLKRLGVWAKSNPDRIAELRAEQRKEDAELEQLWKEAGGKQGPQRPIDLNTASIEELQTINGLGPVLAARIVAGRPYKGVDELDAIKGFGPKKLDKMRPHVFASKSVSHLTRHGGRSGGTGKPQEFCRKSGNRPMRNQILTRASDARSPREAAQMVLDELIETHTNPRDVSLENVKRRLVDALRAWRTAHEQVPATETAPHFADNLSHAAPA